MKINKLFSEENQVSRTLVEDSNVAGSATYNTSKTVQNSVVQFNLVMKTKRTKT